MQPQSWNSANSRPPAIDAYRNAINESLKVSKVVYADRVTDILLLEFFDSLRKLGGEERTVQNKWQYLRTLSAE